MNEILTIFKKSVNTRLYIVFRFINSLWFIEASWYFFWGRFLTYEQIGIIFSWLVVLGILAEVPTGVIADKWGRKRSVILGTIILAVGGVFNSITTHGWELIVGTSLMSIGRAFISGALEALVYDDLKNLGLTKYWDRLMSFRVQTSLIAYSIAVPIGGYLYSSYYRLPNILETVVLVLSIIIATRFVEKVSQKNNELPVTLSSYVVGFRQLTQVKLRPYILTSFLIISVYELYDWGLSKPAMAVSFGYDSSGQAIIYTIFAIVNVLFLQTLKYWRKLLGDFYGLLLINLISGLAFIISTYLYGQIGLLSMLAIELSGNIGDPWSSSVINDKTESRYRATTISTLAFMAQIPHFFVNIFAGHAIDSGNISSFHRVLGIVIVGLSLTALLLRKNTYLTRKA